MFTHAALMGDLVASEQASDKVRLHELFNATVHLANQRHRHVVSSPLTITLGDEFQGLCTTFSAAVAIMREMRWRLLQETVQCRFVVGLVAIHGPVNAKAAWNMVGEGLSGTRQKIEDKRDPSVYRFHIPGDPVTELLLNALGGELTEAEAAWTNRQREMMLAYFETKDVAAAARRLGVIPSGGYKLRSAARHLQYESKWSVVAEAAELIDERIAA